MANRPTHSSARHVSDEPTVGSFNCRKTSDVIWQDSQHRALFETLDLIARPDSGPEVLQRLRDYVDSHFALEEEYMARLEYPGLEAHVRAHRRFQQEVNGLFHSGDPDTPEFLAAASLFLTEWLTRHVMGIDKELEAFLLQSDTH
ncbi:bacteriohemerythrin [Parahaliea mediterranea]|uniref:bacteriohemerythrin n=1 Tax=Parahaliea mediterranea TaxID=651086 RepID=UPI0013004C1B|nr:hemerythrin family protein [Parahaliea mediterranea]